MPRKKAPKTPVPPVADVRPSMQMTDGARPPHPMRALYRWQSKQNKKAKLTAEKMRTDAEQGEIGRLLQSAVDRVKALTVTGTAPPRDRPQFVPAEVKADRDRRLKAHNEKQQRASENRQHSEKGY